jgi:hypothetical protein
MTITKPERSQMEYLAKENNYPGNVHIVTDDALTTFLNNHKIIEVPTCYDILYETCNATMHDLQEILLNPSEENITKLKQKWKQDLYLE